MRHAAPRNSDSDPRLNRAGEITVAALVHVIAGLAAGLITLGSALTVWGLWQWLGVN